MHIYFLHRRTWYTASVEIFKVKNFEAFCVPCSTVQKIYVHPPKTSWITIHNAICNRCDYHIIEKSYKDCVSGYNIFLNDEKAKCIITEIKIWVRSWMNGDTCLHLNQYEISKDMLLFYISHDREFLLIIGTFEKNRLLTWLNSYCPCKLLFVWLWKGSIIFPCIC